MYSTVHTVNNPTYSVLSPMTLYMSDSLPWRELKGCGTRITFTVCGVWGFGVWKKKKIREGNSTLWLQRWLLISFTGEARGWDPSQVPYVEREVSNTHTGRWRVKALSYNKLSTRSETSWRLLYGMLGFSTVCETTWKKVLGLAAVRK